MAAAYLNFANPCDIAKQNPLHGLDMNEKSFRNRLAMANETTKIAAMYGYCAVFLWFASILQLALVVRTGETADFLVWAGQVSLAVGVTVTSVYGFSESLHALKQLENEIKSET